MNRVCYNTLLKWRLAGERELKRFYTMNTEKKHVIFQANMAIGKSNTLFTSLFKFLIFICLNETSTLDFDCHLA